MTGPPLLEGWLCVCGLKREAAIWGGPAVVGGGRGDLLEQKLEVAIAAARPAGLISFGVAGALSTDLAVGQAVVGAMVATGDARWICDPATAEALAVRTGARMEAVFGSDQVVADPAAKRALARLGAVVDMESQVAAQAAERHGLPLAVLRVVSDGAAHVLPPAAIAGMREDGDIDVMAVIARLARDPRQLPALMRMARSSGIAFEGLAALRTQLR